VAKQTLLQIIVLRNIVVPLFLACRVRASPQDSGETARGASHDQQVQSVEAAGSEATEWLRAAMLAPSLETLPPSR